jgi:hypothetical protein
MPSSDGVNLASDEAGRSMSVGIRLPFSDQTGLSDCYHYITDEPWTVIASHYSLMGMLATRMRPGRHTSVSQA